MDTMRNVEDSDKARHADSADPPRFVGLFQGIIEDLKKLVRQQIQLAIHELKMEADRVATIVATAVGIGILITLCLTFLLLTAVAALHEVAGFSMWMSCGVIAVTLMIAAGCSGLYLKQQMQCFRILPIRALYTVKEDIRWIKEWIASPRT